MECSLLDFLDQKHNLVYPDIIIIINNIVFMRRNYRPENYCFFLFFPQAPWLSKIVKKTKSLPY